MKRFVICLLLLAALSACAGAGTSAMEAPASSEGGPASSGPVFRCIEELCIRLTVEEPIRLGEPVAVTVTVTGKKDIPGLKIYLGSESFRKVAVEEPALQGWVEDGYVNWLVDAKANQPLTFTRKILLPAEEGDYDIRVYANFPNGLVIVDYATIYITKEGGKVYYSGTPISTGIVTEPPYTPSGSTPTSIPAPTPLGAETSSP